MTRLRRILVRVGALMSEPRLVSTLQAARLLGVHPDTVRRAAKAGRIEPIRLGERGHLRFRVREIERIARGGERPCPALSGVGAGRAGAGRSGPRLRLGAVRAR